MGLKEQLLEDMRTAMREKNTVRRDAIRMARSAIQYAEMDKQAPLDEAEVVAVIAKEVKKRHEAIELFAMGGRQDLVDAETESVAYLEVYLPKQLPEAEIEAMAQEVIAELGATGMGQMGPVMREIMSRVQGQADGKVVNQIVRSLLSS